MNLSTENVTISGVYLQDILNFYKDKKEEYKELFDISKGYDFSNPNLKVPISVYNEACAWIERELGRFNLIRVGRQIGETVYLFMLKSNLVNAGTKPEEILDALIKIANTTVSDPHNRGWEIVESKPTQLLVKRTQTFNGKLQFGLLDGLIRKSGVLSVNVDYAESIENGAEFDVYRITWVNPSK